MNKLMTETEDRCRVCGGDVSTRIYEHNQMVGRWKVADRSGMAPQCNECKEPQLTLDDLEGYQLRAVKTAMCDGHVEGEVIRYARKALGLTQKELAAILGYAHETVSRWENNKEELPRSASQALIGILMRAIDGEDPQDILESVEHPSTRSSSEAIEVVVPLRRAC